MSEFLAAAAAAIGGPEELVARSARARAAATGTDYEAILQAWAGGGAAPAPSAAPSTEPAEKPTEETPADSAPTTAPEPAAPVSEPVEPLVPSADPAQTGDPSAPRIVDGPPPPETVTVDEAADWEVVTTVPAAGLKERTGSLIPAWLMGFFVVIPLFAVAYITVNSNGPECGSGGQLRVDFRNELVNCDGSEYQGAGGPGAGGVNYVAIGADVYTNVAQCAGCHGSDGGGTSAGPSLLEVNATFGACADHQQWVNLGSQGWIDTIGSSYGDTNKSAGGFGAKMPGFASLSDEQLAAVAVYERVVIGGAGIDETLANCGLVETDVAPTDGETTSTTEAPA